MANLITNYFSVKDKSDAGAALAKRQREDGDGPEEAVAGTSTSEVPPVADDGPIAVAPGATSGLNTVNGTQTGDVSRPAKKPREFDTKPAPPSKLSTSIPMSRSCRHLPRSKLAKEKSLRTWRHRS